MEPTKLGSGWISGLLSTALGLASLGAVLCLRFPALLTSPHLREIYPMDLVRGLIHGALIAAFSFGMISIVLRNNKTLGLVGIALALLGTLLGGSSVPVNGPVGGIYYVGLDWFLLELFMLALVFIPLEKLFPRIPQSVFRAGWSTDLAHFLLSHVLVQILILLTLGPAAVLFRWALNLPFQQAIGAQPAWVQFVEILVLADLTEYAIHRSFHAVPFLWRFHAIHHSSTSMDWLAGSRLHLVDIVLTRALAFIPLYALGFAQGPVYGYLIFVSFHAVFIHSNLRFRFGALAQVIGTPQFHHWHHSAQEEALDKNFAVHLPLIDRVFGTLHLPKDRWPTEYGIAGTPVPAEWWAQFAWPFTREAGGVDASAE